MKTKLEEKELVLKTCLKAGKIMTESGSEVYRVEDTMNRIAANAGFPHSVSYVTATGLFMGIGNEPITQLENVMSRSIDLEKVALVNQLSRRFQQEELSLEEFYQELKKLEQAKISYHLIWQLVAAGVVSSTLVYMFGGGVENMLPGFLIAFIAYYCHRLAHRFFDIQFLPDFLAALTVGTLAIFSTKLGFGSNSDSIIIGAVMPLVPGVAITNAFRDILQGHLLAGTARGMEALFTAGAIGIGIAIALKLFL